MSQDPNIRGLVQRWLALHRDPPTLLYHYTNAAAGLFGMLKSKKMWATNSRFLNDPTEMEYAIQLVWAAKTIFSEAWPCVRRYSYAETTSSRAAGKGFSGASR
jgi:hypothetical protein